jgi:glycosyltransferase involved in cell wall biosynthesis
VAAHGSRIGVAALMMKHDLFIGMTTWNSAGFLAASLGAIRRNTDSRRTRVVILDNYSTDATVEIARDFDAKVVRRRSSQAMAAGDLFNFSRAEYTLLVHADVVLMNPDWFTVCARHLTDRVALISPEDIGCGPFTRPWGSGKPESSFLFFRTQLARKTRITMHRRRFRLRLPVKMIDLNGDHLTYNLPVRMQEAGLDWKAMSVHTSERLAEPIYTPRFPLPQWRPDLALYRYGLGNFYSIDGVITHYHNWFERAFEDVADDSEKTLPASSGGLPIAFLKAYTKAFLDDLSRNAVRLPEIH